VSASGPRVGLYCRVSTTGQTAENQLLALRSFAVARGWTVTEFVDHGVSGAKEKRPAWTPFTRPPGPASSTSSPA
jgi:DNA invertase Pin-like site-specific DNA recombinase